MFPSAPRGPATSMATSTGTAASGLELRLHHIEAEKHPEYWERVADRARRHQADGLPRVLPHRRRVHQLVEGQRDPGGAGPRIGRGLAHCVGDAHHRHRSHPVRPAVRALPQPRAGRCPTSTSTSARTAAKRPSSTSASSTARPCQPDHHLRQAQGEGRRARRRPRARPQLQRGRSHRQAGPRRPQASRSPRPSTGSPQLRAARRRPQGAAGAHLAQAVEGLCRQTGVHAAGVVIADRPLVEYAPLYRDEPEGGPVVQYDMKSAESIGLIKFDFLGLKTLDQIRDAVINIEEQPRRHARHVGDIPTDDAATYELLQRATPWGCSSSSPAACASCSRGSSPTRHRRHGGPGGAVPAGPLQSGMTDDFVERKHGRKRSSTRCRCSSRSSRAPTARSSTRSRSCRSPR